MPRISPILAALLAALPAFGAKVDYNEDVRPILSENCFYCHGPDGNKRKAKLRRATSSNASPPPTPTR
jgi:cytochrome c553